MKRTKVKTIRFFEHEVKEGEEKARKRFMSFEAYVRDRIKKDKLIGVMDK